MRERNLHEVDHQEDKQMGDRSVLLAHDSSEESLAAINALQTRRGKEQIMLVDVTKCEWSEPLGYKIPFLTSPEGTFQGLDAIREYVRRPERFRRK